MEPKQRIAVYPLDVYALTTAGQDELKRGSTVLTPEELELLVLIDGQANVREIGERARSVSQRQIGELLPKLISTGLVRMGTIADEDGLDFSYFFDADKPAPEPSAQAKARAATEAESGTPALQRQGYYVSIARQANVPRKPASSEQHSVLIVEDDQHLCGFLRNLLRLEGFQARTAMNRAEVIAALRQLPSPDLVLLDVVLPDANGFDILMRIKQHPALKATAVIMLTGKATRESVMRGLAGGADGYLTKPFEPEILITGVKSVLGLASD